MQRYTASLRRQYLMVLDQLNNYFIKMKFSLQKFKSHNTLFKETASISQTKRYPWGGQFTRKNSTILKITATF